jgi:uncharacterized protein (DUF1810 family)
MPDLSRFIDAQKHDYQTAFNEIKSGRKRSHWMWYVFPQIQGLGTSSTSRFFAIRDRAEAAAFIRHPVLGSRLIAISNELLSLPGNDAYSIFGSPDDMKLKSCMTLFAALNDPDPVFQSVLEKFFNSQPDVRTIALLNNETR